MINLRIKQKLLWSLLGYGLPLLVAIFAIPWLIQQLGDESFGLLTLAWVLVGIAGVFDFGLGRAFTKVISESIADQCVNQLWHQMLFILKAMLFTSLMVFLLSELASAWLVQQVLILSDGFKDTALLSMSVLFFSVPIIIVSNLFIAILEGTGNVAPVAASRAVMGVLILVLPMVAWHFQFGMIGVMLSLIVARLIAFVGYGLAAIPIMQSWYHQRMSGSSRQYWALFRSGSWMSVSTMLAPMLTVTDRFIIGAVLSVSMVTYYATPVDMLMKLQVFSAALMSVVFPAFAASYVVNETRARELYAKSLLLLGFVMFSIALVTFLLGKWLLALWLSDVFAEESKWVLYWAAIGLFVNALSFVPFGLLQAVGRADVTAKLNLAEVPIYFALLFWMISLWGIAGAAVASTFRLALNAYALFYFAGRYYPQVQNHSWRAMAWMTIGLCVLLLFLGNR